jgi:hypothetical protein
MLSKGERKFIEAASDQELLSRAILEIEIGTEVSETGRGYVGSFGHVWFGLCMLRELKMRGLQPRLFG